MLASKRVIMDIRKDQHQGMFMSNLQEDFKDDDDDDEENRLLISLDDTDMKDHSLDDCLDSPLKHVVNAQNIQRASNAAYPISQYDPNPVNLTNAETEMQKEKNIENTSLASHTSLIARDHLKDASLINECKKKRSSTCRVDSQTLGPMQIMQESSVSVRRRVNESSEDLFGVKEEIGLDRAQDYEAKSARENSIVIPQGSRNEVTRDTNLIENPSESENATAKSSVHQQTEFVPHRDCSCIMCYQGRGIIDSNWIPTAEKRKMEVSDNHCPKRPRNKSVIHVPNDKHVLESVPSRPQMSKSVSQSYSSNSNVFRTQNNSTNYVLIIPHTSVSSDASPVLTSGQRLVSSSSTSQTMSSAVLPVFVPRPNLFSSTSQSPMIATSSSVFMPSIVSKLTSQANFTMVTSSPALSLTSTVKTPVSCASPSDKTHVVVIDKSTVDKQLADLNFTDIIQQATKLDMSSPGVVRVYYKPTSSQLPVLKVSKKSTTPLSQNNTPVSMHRAVASKSKHTEHTIMGLVKHHLEHSFTPPTKQKPINTTQSLQKSSKAAPAPVPGKPSLVAKPKVPYSLVTRRFLPGRSLNSQGGSGQLPPPPPLMPRPGSMQDGAPRPSSQYKMVEVINLEEDQTETIVLPLPKNSLKKTSSDGESSLEISKQNEMLMSPSLFTFSSPLELSPQKGSQEPSASGQYQNLPSNPSDSALSQPAHPGVIVRSPSSVSSLSYIPITTMSSSSNWKNSVQYTQSSVDSPQVVSHIHATELSRGKNSVNHNNNSHLQSFVTSSTSLNHRKFPNISHPTGRVAAQIRQDEGLIRSLLQHSSPQVSHTTSSNAHTNTSLSSSQSSVSIVNDTSGLKMKIRLKDSRPEGKPSPLIEEQQKHKSVDMCLSEKLIYSNSESEAPPHVSMAQGCSSIPSLGLADTISGTRESISPKNMERAGSLSSRQETAEEMFKRFEDQAMQEVYNAQFGVGQINRSLRPNRTSFFNPGCFLTHSKNTSEPKKTNIDDKKETPIPSEISKSDAPAVVVSRTSKSVPRNRRKRASSGEARHKVTVEKSIKLDINQYPKLMQDNSILNRKTIYTPSILAGHKVFVKFNTFSNLQSGRSFLVPFFNIGGSRTQFDVEDMEYINRAVVDFEKEERSCARHLLYYSREGNKASFLRKETGSHSLEVTSKSYKKNSYILQGYTREKPKQPEKSPEEWKVDSVVAIEIDCAEQDCEIESPLNHSIPSNDNLDKIAHKAKQTVDQSSSQSSEKKLLSKITKLASSPTFLQNSSSTCTCPDSEREPGCIHDHNKGVPKQPSEPGRTAVSHSSHRERVNILKRKMDWKKQTFNGVVSPSSLGSPVENSPSYEADYSYTEQLEKIMSANVDKDANGSLSTFCGTPKLQTDSVCSESNTSEPKSQVSHGTDSLVTVIPHIKSEVVDDGYEAALTSGKNNIMSSAPGHSQVPDINIKSEPVDDYTESLARSMNVSLQENISASLTSPIKDPSPSQQDEEEMIHKSDDLPSNDPKLSFPSQAKDECPSREDGSATSNLGIQDNTLPKVTEPLPEPGVADASVAVERNIDAICSDGNENSLTDLDDIETTLSDPASSPVSDSSTVPSSSEVESSTDEDDEEMGEEDSFSISTLSVSSTPQSESTNAPAANKKISSLVESLKQRLVQNAPTFPLFPDIQLPKKPKTKKEKRVKVKKKIKLNSKETSVLGTAESSTDPLPAAGGESQLTSGKFANPISIGPPGKASKDENTSCDSLVDVKPVLLPIHSSSLPSSASQASLCASTISTGSTNSVNSPSLADSRCKVMSLESTAKEISNVEKDVASQRSKSIISVSSSNCDNVENLSGISSQASTHMENTTTTLHEEKADRTLNIIPPETELKEKEKNDIDEEICQLNDIDASENIDATAKKWNNAVRSTCNANGGIPNFIHDVSEGSSGIESVGAVEKDRFLNQCPESNRSTPCSEIDVGTEEVDLTLTLGKAENPVRNNLATLVSLLTSPPVPSSGKNSIKDFTREHDLMVPFVNVPKSHSAVSSMRRKVSARDFMSETWSSTNKDHSGKNTDSVKASPISHQKAKENTPLTDIKPSIASLLCQKLAIDVDPVVDPVKWGAVKTAPISAKTKVLNIEERSSPSTVSRPAVTVSGSFYKPTLSAIFGVDNIAVKPPEDEKNDNVESPITTRPGKTRRQVALKAVCNRQSAQKRSRSLADKKAVRKLPPTKLKPKCNAPPSTKTAKEQVSISSKKAPEIKNKAKARAAIQKEKRRLQNVFRTWRQLSHEERMKKEKVCPEVCPPQICTVPCKVVLHRLRLDEEGNPIMPDNDDKMSASAAESSQKKEPETTESNQEAKEQRPIVNARRKKKKTVQRRRQPRDIIDYYASMLENLRKKAEMLEKEEIAKRDQEESRNRLSVSERTIKLEPIVFEDESCHVVSREEKSGTNSNEINNSVVQPEPIAATENSNGGAEVCAEGMKNIIDSDQGNEVKLSEKPDNNDERRKSEGLITKNAGDTDVTMEDDSLISEKLPVPCQTPCASNSDHTDNSNSRDDRSEISTDVAGTSVCNETEKLFANEGGKSKNPDHDISHQIGDVKEKDAIVDHTSNSFEREIIHGNSTAKDHFCLTDQVSDQNGNVNTDEDKDNTITIASDLPPNPVHSNQTSIGSGKVNISPNSGNQMESETASLNSNIDIDKNGHSSHDGDSSVRQDCESEIAGQLCPKTSIQTSHPSIDRSNSFLSDSSEPGGLVIDYESEQDTAKDTGKSSDEVGNEKKNPMSFDASDILSDSSFRTKDIVLGFENELGADTVISTLSQGDMEDLFLLGDGEEDSQIGMIPEEEVEKLLGLDVASEAENESLSSKQAKGESSSSSSATSLPASSDNGVGNSKLCWIPLFDGKSVESKTKAGDEAIKPTSCSGENESKSGDQPGRPEPVKPCRDSSPDTSKSEHHLQAQQKNLQVSPSWNRLLGSEALRQMEKSVSSSASNAQSSGGQQAKPLLSTGQLKVKFCAGALSKALKLSAEMKKVFSEGVSSQDASMRKCPESAKKASVQSELKAVSFEEPESKDRKASQEPIKSDLGHPSTKPQNVNTTAIMDTCITHEDMPMHRKTRSRSKLQHGQNGSTTASAEHKQADTDTSGAHVVVSVETETPKDTSTITHIINNAVIMSSNAAVTLPISFSNTSCTPTEVFSKDHDTIPVEPQTKRLPPSAKGIDLNKLKLKLNPLLSATNKKSNSAALPKVNDSSCNASISADPGIDSKADVLPRQHDHASVTCNSSTNLESGFYEQDGANASTETKKLMLMVKMPEKQKSDSEPVINTAKLYNLLKNLKKPMCSLKQMKPDGLTPPMSQPSDDCAKGSRSDQSISAKTKASTSSGISGRQLRSSPRLGQNQKDRQGLEKAGSPEIVKTSTSSSRNGKQGDGEMKNVLNLKKAEDDDKGERSFIDCLSDVISGAWDGKT